jgi:hypothetical protein
MRSEILFANVMTYLYKLKVYCVRRFRSYSEGFQETFLFQVVSRFTKHYYYI